MTTGFMGPRKQRTRRKAYRLSSPSPCGPPGPRFEGGGPGRGWPQIPKCKCESAWSAAADQTPHPDPPPQGGRELEANAVASWILLQSQIVAVEPGRAVAGDLVDV